MHVRERVRVFAREHILCMLLMALGRSSSGGVTIRFMDNDIASIG